MPVDPCRECDNSVKKAFNNIVKGRMVGTYNSKEKGTGLPTYGGGYSGRKL
jgi:hypothetical protein